MLVAPEGVIEQLFFAAVHESAFGTKRTSRTFSCLSAFGGKADIASVVSFVRL
jgi:hypothetical protein